MNRKCTLTDIALADICREWVRKLCKKRDAFQMSIPVQVNEDTDMVFCELINRFKALSSTPLPPISKDKEDYSKCCNAPMMNGVCDNCGKIIIIKE